MAGLGILGSFAAGAASGAGDIAMGWIKSEQNVDMQKQILDMQAEKELRVDELRRSRDLGDLRAKSDMQREYQQRDRDELSKIMQGDDGDGKTAKQRLIDAGRIDAAKDYGAATKQDDESKIVPYGGTLMRKKPDGTYEEVKSSVNERLTGVMSRGGKGGEERDRMGEIDAKAFYAGQQKLEDKIEKHNQNLLEGKYGLEGTPQYAKAEKVIADLQRQKYRNQAAFDRGGDLSVTNEDKQALLDAAKDPKTLPTKIAKFNYLFGEGQAEKILDWAKPAAAPAEQSQQTGKTQAAKSEKPQAERNYDTGSLGNRFSLWQLKKQAQQGVAGAKEKYEKASAQAKEWGYEE